MAGSVERGTDAQTIIRQPNCNGVSQACKESRNEFDAPCDFPTGDANEYACR